LSYIDELAAAIQSAVPPQLVPDGDTSALFRTYAVLALAKGENVVLEDVHDAWAAWMADQDENHDSLKPMAELTPDIQEADRPYLDAIRVVSRARGIGR
jgi:hypothetical protein